MVALLVAGGISMLFALIGTPVLIRYLEASGVGQPIRDDGPQGHFVKAGTPTMGGLMIVSGAVMGYIIGHLRSGAIYTRGGLLVLGLVAAIGAIGLADDWRKIREERSLGLSRRLRVGAEIAIALLFAFFAQQWAHVSTALAFTRFDSFAQAQLPKPVWLVWAALLIIGAANAVNISDGLDGLAAGSATFAFSALAIIGFWQFRHFSVYQIPQAQDLAIVAISLTGGCVGFLWWNAAPARIFMGDTGALGIGAGLAGLALVMKLDLLLPIVAGLFVLITMSDIIQIFSFRFFHRRVFRMAPLHHHFELLGWPETTVLIRFWILAGLCTAIALGVFYADFISLGVLD